MPTSSQHHADRPRDVKVRLQYLKNDPIYDVQKPLQITPPFLDFAKRTNVRLAAGDLETIHDVRNHAEKLSLDVNGFTYVRAPTDFSDWSSQPRIAQAYLPELEVLLRQEVEGCDEIIFYDARIRRKDDAGLRVEGLSYNAFAKQVHTDNTETSVLTKIRNLTEMKADYLLSGRARIINIWRPIRHPVYDCGLAVADSSVLRDDDVIECDRYRQDTNEFWDTMGVVKYRKGFRWYYMFEQDEPDVLLFKNYDSDANVKARTCLHTAFDLPSDSIPTGSPPRESIEVRALVFTFPTDGPRRTVCMPHPLAQRLELGLLKCIDAEPSITDRARTDIDECHEIKDAMLILRKQEIQRLELMQQKLKSERDELIKELELTRQQVILQTRYTEALQAQVQDLSHQLKRSDHDLRTNNTGLGTELMNTHLHRCPE